MLIFKDTKFIKSPFDSEAELEQVIVDNYEYLFGPTSFYLPKAKIKTADGVGTIPDGFAIDIGQKKWYLVEAELMHHSVWNHIAPQVTKQILASQQSITKRTLVDLAVEQYQADPYTKEKFEDLSIAEINVRQVVGDILETDPIIGVPIDGVTNDLRDWARTLKYKVKLWVVSKFVEFNKPTNIVFEFPEEFKPELDTEEESKPQKANTDIAQYDVELTDLVNASLLTVGEKLTMAYKPRNGQQKKYEATVLEDGSLELLGQQFSSPSYAALAGIQNAGSDRKTVNGWTSWKTQTNTSNQDSLASKPKSKKQIYIDNYIANFPYKNSDIYEVIKQTNLWDTTGVVPLPAPNSTYTQGGVPFSADSFVGIESSVLRINFSGNLPALRVAANR